MMSTSAFLPITEVPVYPLNILCMSIRARVSPKVTLIESFNYYKANRQVRWLLAQSRNVKS